MLNARIANLERVVERVSIAVSSIDESLKVLTRLDVKHDETRTGLARAFSAIEDHEERMRSIEKEMPTMKLGIGWLFAGIASAIGIIALVIVRMIYK